MHESPWHVLHVIANHEKRVAQHLSVRSLEHYLPLYTERSRWTDRSVVLDRPLFAGYVFVRFSLHARLCVISTPGVIRLLGDHECDTVNAEEIDMNPQRAGERLLIKASSTCRCRNPGARAQRRF